MSNDENYNDRDSQFLKSLAHISIEGEAFVARGSEGKIWSKSYPDIYRTNPWKNINPTLEEEYPGWEAFLSSLGIVLIDDVGSIGGYPVRWIDDDSDFYGVFEIGSRTSFDRWANSTEYSIDLANPIGRQFIKEWVRLVTNSPLPGSVYPPGTDGFM